ncbi:MAG: hypothetical protein PHQ27_02680 [Victivallales bacterium]|nr:hypothetical protein [Victivallales bacterium]
MVQWVNDLLVLQNVDMRIRGLIQRQGMIPQEIVRLRKEIATVAEGLKSARENANKTSLEIKSLESQIKQKNEHIAKLQVQSGMVKKNTEYQAMMKEITELKSGISDLETREIELLDQADERKNAFRNTEKEANAKKQSLEEEIQELQQLTGELKEEIARQQEARVPLVAKLDTDVLTRYNRLLKATGTPLVKIDNGICGHCHLKVIPQTLHEVGKGAVTTCENCGHLVYC